MWLYRSERVLISAFPCNQEDIHCYSSYFYRQVNLLHGESVLCLVASPVNTNVYNSDGILQQKGQPIILPRTLGPHIPCLKQKSSSQCHYFCVGCLYITPQ